MSAIINVSTLKVKEMGQVIRHQVFSVYGLALGPALIHNNGRLRRFWHEFMFGKFEGMVKWSEKKQATS